MDEGMGRARGPPGKGCGVEMNEKERGWRLKAKDLDLSALSLPACPAQCHRMKGGVKKREGGGLRKMREIEHVSA